MKIILVFLVFFVEAMTGLRVLISHPFYCGSHVLTVHSVTKTLLSRGHSVTTVKYADDRLPMLKPHPNFTVIDLFINNTDGRLPYIEADEYGRFILPVRDMWEKGTGFIWSVWMTLSFHSLVLASCDSLLDPKIIKYLEKDTYDVAIVDLVMNDCGLAVANRLNVPVIGFGFAFAGGSQELTTMDANPSFVPMLMSQLASRMTFTERSINFVLKSVSKIAHWLHSWSVGRHIRQFLPDSPPPSELYANLSGMLINSDYVLEFPRSHPPTFLNTGGMSINPNLDKLPVDLQMFLDSADEGAILFSLGYIFIPEAVPEEYIRKLLVAFSKLPQKIILKFNIGEAKLEVPSNVMVMPFVPQQSILNHSNLVLFVTHCGVNSVLESIFYQVPMVGIPVFLDQVDVIRRVETKGLGVRLERSSSSDEMASVMKHVIETKQYKDNVKRLSEIMKLRRHSTLEDAVWLLEFVGQTKGAHHLKLESRHLNLIQYYCLDSIVFFLLLLLIPALFLRRALVRTK